jgi:hypothetical protein
MLWVVSDVAVNFTVHLLAVPAVSQSSRSFRLVIIPDSERASQSLYGTFSKSLSWRHCRESLGNSSLNPTSYLTLHLCLFSA